MPVPDMLPKTPNEPTEMMRRQRAVESIRENLALAVIRIHQFMKNTPEAQAIKKMHFADTNVHMDENSQVRMRYYSLWDSKGLRLLQTGRLAKPLDNSPNQRLIDANGGADESEIIDINRMSHDYNIAQLADIALRLSKIANFEENEEARR